MIRVLLCDPNRAEWETAKAVLERSSKSEIRVDWAAAVPDAGQAIRSGKCDVCLVKDTFAGGRWAELVQQTNSEGKRVPLILLITTEQEDQGVGAIRDGAADVLVPGEVSGPQLERAIMRTVERQKHTAPSGQPPSIPPPDSPAALRHRLKAAMARARRGLSGVAVLWLHLAELVDAPIEQLIPATDQVTRRLHSCMREVDTLSQLDRQFVIVVEDKDVETVAARMAHDLIAVFAEPLELPGVTLNVTASVGIAAYPEDGEDGPEILANARIAVNAVIKSGAGRFRFRSKALNQRAARRLTLQAALQGALERAEFELFYQPQVDLATREFVAVEALLRWQHEKLGKVPPGEFVPVLESTGQIEAMEKWVIAEACCQAREWMDDGHPVRVNINVSARQFQERDVGTEMKNALKMFDVPPELLGVEITEGLLLDSNPAIRSTFDELRKLGVAIAVDDFGTGHSSLSFVRRYPMDVIKIDREFVRGLPDDKDNAGIAGAIIALARSLQLTAVAEGIESRAEEEFLRSEGCHLGQGFLYAPPMRVDDLAAWRDSGGKSR